MTFFKKKKIIFNLIFLFLLGIILFIIKNKNIKAINDRNSNAISNNSSMSILEMLTPPENNYVRFKGFEKIFGQEELKKN
ncbi:MAG: putative secreted protein [Candidatus Phytoplasma pruni]|nr:MAG: putative secreted protein [Candidatus Phytoplasma pruni]